MPRISMLTNLLRRGSSMGWANIQLDPGNVCYHHAVRPG